MKTFTESQIEDFFSMKGDTLLYFAVFTEEWLSLDFLCTEFPKFVNQKLFAVPLHYSLSSYLSGQCFSEKKRPPNSEKREIRKNKFLVLLKFNEKEMKNTMETLEKEIGLTLALKEDYKKALNEFETIKFHK